MTEQQQLDHEKLKALLSNFNLTPGMPSLFTPANLSLTHNLIPSHLQSLTLAAESLNGTPGYSPAFIPSPADRLLHQQRLAAGKPLTSSDFNTANSNNPSVANTPVFSVQERPFTTPVYNGVNPQYPGLNVVNTTPPIFCVENFLTPFECEFLIHVAQDSFGPAPVVGKGAGEISPSRTSSTCYLAREDLPDVLRKISCLTGKPVEHCELPQVGRYLPSQQYLQHYDAFDLSTEDGMRFATNGGQRTITVLIYLNDVARGGATRFPALNLEVQPRRGMALVFFPSTIDGYLDKSVLHAAMPAIDTKYVSQVWIRQSNYNGQPSKRLPQTLGLPFSSTNVNNTQQEQQSMQLPSSLQQQQHLQLLQHQQQQQLLRHQQDMLHLQHQQQQIQHQQLLHHQQQQVLLHQQQQLHMQQQALQQAQAQFQRSASAHPTNSSDMDEQGEEKQKTA